MKKSEITEALGTIARDMGIDPGTIKLDFPENPAHGDFTSNIAMMNAKKLGQNPRALAEKIVAALTSAALATVEKIEIAGPGFINFFLKKEVMAKEAVSMSDHVAVKISGTPHEILIEYTDPNTFKVFHIGHLMSNAIGESLSRLIEHGGAKVVRMCYPSDIGLHIAKSIWAIQKHAGEMPKDSAPIAERTDFLGRMYVEGTKAYEADPAAKDDIDALNKVLYEKSSPDVNALYMKGRQWSLDHFDALYARLGTTFDRTIFESEMAPVGLAIVKEFEKKGVFEESQGAVIFKGENVGLHTRVFINAAGLPTYEAKEIGLNTTKFKEHPHAAQSIIVTASEQNDYFKVLVKALGLIDPKIGEKTVHIGHGMMRFASGKMSSRTGNVVTAEALIDDIRALVKEKIAGRKFSAAEAEDISDTIAIGAIKYTILRQAIGGNIVFDSAASISFEGDSGPYLQYAAVRARSILDKARAEHIQELQPTEAGKFSDGVGQLERLMTRFGAVTERARAELAPHLVATYLIELAGEFNAFYAKEIIVDSKDPRSPYRVALTGSFLAIMTAGLNLLGIKVPSKM